MIVESLKEEKMYVKFSKQCGADDFVVYYDARSKDLEACLEKGRSKFDFEAKYHLGKANVDVVPWSRKKEWIPRMSSEIDVGPPFGEMYGPWLLMRRYTASILSPSRECGYYVSVVLGYGEGSKVSLGAAMSLAVGFFWILEVSRGYRLTRLFCFVKESHDVVDRVVMSKKRCMKALANVRLGFEAGPGALLRKCQRIQIRS
ncbi:hypothetical protein Tco_0733373 [Tanacetum coccineum]